MTQIPDKLYFKIGEVATLLQVKTHVLRYWETEFTILQPVKSNANQRLYRKKDVETALLIKELLYHQGFTITGARKKLNKDRQLGLPLEPITTATEIIAEVKSDLEHLRSFMTRLPKE